MRILFELLLMRASLPVLKSNIKLKMYQFELS